MHEKLSDIPIDSPLTPEKPAPVLEQKFREQAREQVAPPFIGRNQQ